MLCFNQDRPSGNWARWQSRPSAGALRAYPKTSQVFVKTADIPRVGVADRSGGGWKEEYRGNVEQGHSETTVCVVGRIMGTSGAASSEAQIGRSHRRTAADSGSYGSGRDLFRSAYGMPVEGYHAEITRVLW